MKKFVSVCLVAAACVICVLPVTVKAGNINSEEQRLIDAADKTYTYDGKKYKPSDAAKDKAMNYLLQDDVDLTKDQVDKAIGMLEGSVEKGIVNGYLVEVPEQKKPSDGENQKDENPSAASTPAPTDAQPVGESTQTPVTAPVQTTQEEAKRSQNDADATTAFGSAVEEKAGQVEAESVAETVVSDQASAAKEQMQAQAQQAADYDATDSAKQGMHQISPILIAVLVLVVIGFGVGFMLLQRKILQNG